MDNIKGIPYSTAEFDKNGAARNNPTIPAGTTDLLVVSHGWNNNKAEAEALYTSLFGNFVEVAGNDPEIKKRKLAIVGVIWPAQKFDQLVTESSAGGGQAGGAASLGAPDATADKAVMVEAIKRAAPLFDDPGDDKRLKRLQKLADSKLEHDEKAQKEFMKILRELVDPDGSQAGEQHSEDSSDIFFEGQPSVIFENASKPTPASASGPKPKPPPATPGSSRADGAGSAAGFFGRIFSKVSNAVTNLMNLTTYFEMKKRAGTVGKTGVAPLIDKLAGQVERVHLVGHSFGGRVVTAAAANSTTKKLQSMGLLQAAFSHNGFSKSKKGFFRSVVDSKRVNGPIFITHTKNDKAVGLAYPAASRLSNDQTLGFGDANDPFGGIGSNGAQQMEAGEIFETTKTMQPVGGAYEWKAGRLHNLDSTKFIIDPKGGDAHGFVFVREVAWAISRAIILK